MRHATSIPFTELVGEEIVKQKYGSDLMPKCGSYGAITLFTASGRELIIWQSYGETNLSEVKSAD